MNESSYLAQFRGDPSAIETPPLKVVTYSTLLYGMDFIRESIRSVRDDASEMWFIYSPTPTFGFHTDLVCPDHAYDLYEAAREAAGDKFRWISASPGQFRNEGEHCDYIFTLVPDADVYVRLDIDEVWQEGLFAAATAYAYERQLAEVRVPIVHAWRSLYRWVTDDPAYPVRVKARGGKGEDTFNGGGKIFHFGYSQDSRVVEYKEKISAHRGEWRTDWYERKFAANAQEDVHPTMVDRWYPKPLDPFELGLPEWMREHKYAALEVIP